MHITGERRIPAPRERVWRSLADAAVLQECVPGSRIEPDGEGGLLLSGLGDRSGRDSDLTPVRAQPTIREQFSTMGWRIDPAGPGTQMVLVRLAEQGVYTLLQYEASLADPDGSLDDRESEIRMKNLRARIDQALERFIHGIAGPGEIGAGGIAGVVQAATQPSAQPTANILTAPATGADGAAANQPSAILGLLNPSVIGGVLFLIVLLFLVGLF